jgi:hypothetical protein
MMKLAARSTLATVAVAVANAALASGDSGTGSVTEMDAGAGTFFGLLGAVVGMGVLVFVILKFVNRPKK